MSASNQITHWFTQIWASYIHYTYTYRHTCEGGRGSMDFMLCDFVFCTLYAVCGAWNCCYCFYLLQFSRASTHHFSCLFVILFLFLFLSLFFYCAFHFVPHRLHLKLLCLLCSVHWFVEFVLGYKMRLFGVFGLFICTQHPARLSNECSIIF